MSEEKEIKIWVLIVGCYSSSTMVGAYDDEHKAEAERVAKAIDGYIEGPLILNKGVSFEEPPAGMEFFMLDMKSTGNAYDVISIGTLECDNGWPDEKSNYRRRQQSYKLEKSKRRWRLHVRLYAKDKEHAVKIAGELRTQLLAGQLPDEGNLPLKDVQ